MHSGQRFWHLYGLNLAVVVPVGKRARPHLLALSHLGLLKLSSIDGSIKLVRLLTQFFLHKLTKLGDLDEFVVALAKTWLAHVAVIGHEPGKDLFVSVEFALLIGHPVRVTRLLVELGQAIGGLLK